MCKSHLTRVTTKFLLLLLALSCQRCAAAGDANTDGCNEFVCGSIVSKCLLTQSCQCKLNNATCLQECLNCLGDLYTECCSCLDMCPKVKDPFNPAAPRSQFGLFEGLPELFETLTEDDDNWTVMRFTMRTSLRRHYGAGFGVSLAGVGSDGGDAIDRQASIQKLQSSATNTAAAVALATATHVNCTVIYLNECKTYHKCAQDCENMGANSYRWFHDGCCECVGANCINYGINESRCSACPEEDENGEEGAGEDYDDESTWTFGEEEHNYN
ncbi:PREDICTED: protein twisted gastrulation-like [Rhagoletis zephyria]|uniref:protein twisted gastrulation-like n=1 Tax=Rhagoletis zephyria TaxID=28612 RepID=UPI0008113ECC|nr:PREDICTED: protein twisted gastrulation-like [Rhagoletis zephyria]XP_036318518.1 protein twisted gastrulation-like [Rhagoletis pomonella]